MILHSNAWWQSATTFLLLIILLTVSPLRAQQPQAASEDTPAVRRAHQIINFINSGHYAEGQKYIQEHFSPAFVRGSVEGLLGFLLGLQDTTRGVEFLGVQEAKPTEALVRLRNKLTGEWVNLMVRTEPTEPYRITGFGLRPGQPPADLKPKKLTPAQMAQELDALMAKLAAADVFSGAVLLAKDGQVIYQKAAGMAHKDFNVPNRVDTKFNLGSMNKMFTAVAIAQLVERGRLSFDDPLSKFLPDFPDKESAEKIKVKHLLSHTAGLGNFLNQKFIESSRARFRTVNDMMALAKDEKLEFEPGSRWRYSNTGMLVLGAVIEKVTGQSYYDYVRVNIYKAAGMTNTDCYELDRVNANLAIGYEKEHTADGIQFRSNIFSHVIRGGPAGGGYSTIGDLLKFVQALRSHKLVGEPYVKLLLSPKPELNSPRYGFGFGINPEKQIAGHSGGFEGVSSNLDIFLTSGYTAIVMSNYGNGALSVVSKLQEIIVASQEAQTTNQSPAEKGSK
jgi:CubicO group peptidase (beta-lactamase class C family)